MKMVNEERSKKQGIPKKNSDCHEEGFTEVFKKNVEALSDVIIEELAARGWDREFLCECRTKGFSYNRKLGLLVQ